MTNYLKELSRSVKNWWMFIVYGIALIACGIYVFSTPVESYLSLSLILGALVLVNGIVQSIFSVQNRHTLNDWGWQLAGGIFEIGFGLVLVFYPGITLITLPYMVGFWLMMRAAYTLAGANELRKLHIKGYGWVIASGIFQAVFASLVLLNPLFGMMYLVVFTAMALISMGAAHIYLGVQLKSINKVTLEKVEVLSQRYKEQVQKAKQALRDEIEKGAKEIQGQMS